MDARELADVLTEVDVDAVALPPGSCFARVQVQERPGRQGPQAHSFEDLAACDELSGVWPHLPRHLAVALDNRVRGLGARTRTSAHMFNGEMTALCDVRVLGDELVLGAQPMSYAAWVVVGGGVRFRSPAPGRAGDQDADLFNGYRLPAPALGVQLAAVTCDGFLVLSRRGVKVASGAGKFTSSASGAVDWEDRTADGQVDVLGACQREAAEELDPTGGISRDRIGVRGLVRHQGPKQDVAWVCCQTELKVTFAELCVRHQQLGDDEELGGDLLGLPAGADPDGCVRWLSAHRGRVTCGGLTSSLCMLAGRFEAGRLRGAWQDPQADAVQPRSSRRT